MPELPTDKRHRFMDQYGLGAYDAGVLVDNRELADYYEAVVAACGDAKIAANWVQVELLGQLNKNELEIGASPVSAEALGGLIQRILDNSISGKIAKQVFAQVEQYLAADDAKRKKLVGYFVGQVMKLSKGQANPQMVNQLLAEKLK